MTEAKAGDKDFGRLSEPFRRELLAYCYRMLGSVDEAEEVVQDVYLDAWRAYDAFEDGRRCVPGCTVSRPERASRRWKK